VLIVYGSFYPWQFTPKHLPGNALGILLHSWHFAFSRFVFRDALVNICLYIPLGFAGYFAFRESRRPMVAFYGPVLLGMLLSASVELLQLYTPHRDTSLLDVAANTLGSAAGVALGLALERIAGPFRHRSSRPDADRSALMLLACWAAWMSFPLFPVLGSYMLIRKAHYFVAATSFDLMPLLSAAAVWYAAGFLLTAAGFRRSVAWLGVSILLVPAQFFVIGRLPTAPQFLGAVAGFLLFANRPRLQAITQTEAWAFLFVVILRGLSPFRFAAEATPFTWVPFGALLDNDWQYGIQVLLEKTFYYTAAIWLLRAAGTRLWPAVAIVAAFLAAIEAIQTHLPDRTPEIMDPLLAILMGFVLFILSHETGKQSQSAGLSQPQLRERSRDPDRNGRP